MCLLKRICELKTVSDHLDAGVHRWSPTQVLIPHVLSTVLLSCCESCERLCAVQEA